MNRSKLALMVLAVVTAGACGGAHQAPATPAQEETRAEREASCVAPADTIARRLVAAESEALEQKLQAMTDATRHADYRAALEVYGASWRAGVVQECVLRQWSASARDCIASASNNHAVNHCTETQMDERQGSAFTQMLLDVSNRSNAALRERYEQLDAQTAVVGETGD